MKDFLGQELNIGDAVCIIVQGYRSFMIGKVIAFTPQQVRVAYMRNEYWVNKKYTELLQRPEMLIKADKPVDHIVKD